MTDPNRPADNPRGGFLPGLRLLPKEVVAEIPLSERDQLELRRGWQRKNVIAHVEQSRIAAAAQTIQFRHIEGIGQKIGVIHPHFMAELRLKYGERCFADPDFIKDTIKKNPFLQIRCTSGKVTIRHPGLPGRRPNSRVGGNGTQREAASLVCSPYVTGRTGFSSHETAPTRDSAAKPDVHVHVHVHTG